MRFDSKVSLPGASWNAEPVHLKPTTSSNVGVEATDWPCTQQQTFHLYIPRPVKISCAVCCVLFQLIVSLMNTCQVWVILPEYPKLSWHPKSLVAWACGETGAPKGSLRRTRGQEKSHKALKFLLSCSMVFSALEVYLGFCCFDLGTALVLFVMLHAARKILCKARKVTLESGTAIRSLGP
jgi:hypothetical protein